MNSKELGQCMTLLSKSFPSGPWDEGVERIWMMDLQSLDYDVALEAIRRVHSIHVSTFCPPWPLVLEAAQAILGDRRRLAEQKALMAPKDAPVMTPAIRALIDETRRKQKSARPFSMHNHHRGAANCPLCGEHDHSDRRPFGFSKVRMRGQVANKDHEIADVEHSEAVPAWWFLCPKCGDPDLAQEQCHSWTSDGIEFMREHGVRVRDTTPTGGF